MSAQLERVASYALRLGTGLLLLGGALAGGLNAWRAAGFPLESVASPRVAAPNH